MTADRRNPEIVVFGIEDAVGGESSNSSNSSNSLGLGHSSFQARPEHLTAADVVLGSGEGSVGGAADRLDENGPDENRPDENGPDEIRQGDDPDRRRRPLLPGVTRRWDSVVVYARRAAPRRVALAVSTLVVIAFVAGVVVGRRSHDAAPPGAAVLPFSPGFAFPLPTYAGAAIPDQDGDAGPRISVASVDVYAMQLKSTPVNQARQSQQIVDPGATRGPWSVIVRRSDGSLGRHGAVVTYPVPSVTIGPAVQVGKILRHVVRPTKGRSAIAPAVVTGHVDEAAGIVWPIDGKFARIRGDVGRSTLLALAARVTIRHGQPAVTDLPTGYGVIVSEPYRARVVTQSSYTDSLRVDSGPIDGLIYSAVVIGGASFEEALYSETTVPGGIISGDPAIRSPVGGGSATLAWEVAPGIVAFVGYSGGLIPSASGPSLIELARGGHLLGHAQWLATHPSTTRGQNDYS